MAVMGIRFLKKGKMLDGAMWFGKVCTATLFIGLVVLFFAYDLSAMTANIIIAVMMVFMVFALCMYIPVYHKMGKELRDDPQKRFFCRFSQYIPVFLAELTVEFFSSTYYNSIVSNYYRGENTHGPTGDE